MLSDNLRPWGLLSWVIEKLPACKWDYIGSISTEDRSLAVVEEIPKKIRSILMLEIKDFKSRFTVEIGKILAKNRKKFYSLINSGIRNTIRDCVIDEKFNGFITDADGFVSLSNGNIILDISTLPKRFFFPLLKRILQNKNNKNVLVTYTVPETYYNGALAEDMMDIESLPLFSALSPHKQTPDIAFIGIGFSAMKVTEIIKYHNCGQIKFFFPFPPGPPSYFRNIEFLEEIYKDLDKDVLQKVIKVNANDTSDVFDYICNYTNNGSDTAIFVPYGPKPISLAMCIYAYLTESPVYYSQPKVYNPKYSSGIKKTDGRSTIYTYCVRLNGKDLFRVRSKIK